MLETTMYYNWFMTCLRAYNKIPTIYLYPLTEKSNSLIFYTYYTAQYRGEKKNEKKKKANFDYLLSA